MRRAKVTWCRMCRTIGGEHLSSCPGYVRPAQRQWVGGLLLAGAFTLQAAQDPQTVHIDWDGDNVVDFTMEANVITSPTGDLLVSSAVAWAGAPATLPFVPSSEQAPVPPAQSEAPIVPPAPPTEALPPVDVSECVAEGVPEWMCAPAAPEAPADTDVQSAPPAQPQDPAAQLQSAVAQAVPAVPSDVLEVRQAKMSHYWPPLGGVNCAVFAGGECMSTMADGTPWQQGIGTAAGCPREIPFGTRIRLPDGSVWTCQDRGSKVVTEYNGTIWLDLLEETARYDYGEVVSVEILRWGW